MSREKYKYVGFALIVILLNYAITNFSSFASTFSFLYGVVRPIIFGIVIAYFVYPLVMLLYTKVFNKIEFKYVKNLSYYVSIFISYMLIFSILYMLYHWVSPMIVDSVHNISNLNFDALYKNLTTTWVGMQNDFSFLEDVQLVDVFKNSLEKGLNFLSTANLSSYLKSILGITSSLYAVIMGIIVSIYMIVSKEELFKASDMFFEAVLNEEHFKIIKRYFLYFEKTFKKFFFGKMLDSLIIGIIAFIGMFFLKIPFYPLLAIIVMVTNMIPYFGPFIGGIPVVIVTLFVTGDPLQAFWSALFILLLQQFDGIYLGPKILGDSVGVSSVWVLIAIIIGGALFKVVGLFLCVPIAATLKYMFGEFYEYRMSKRKKNETSAE